MVGLRGSLIAHALIKTYIDVTDASTLLTQANT